MISTAGRIQATQRMTIWRYVDYYDRRRWWCNNPDEANETILFYSLLRYFHFVVNCAQQMAIFTRLMDTTTWTARSLPRPIARPYSPPLVNQQRDNDDDDKKTRRRPGQPFISYYYFSNRNWIGCAMFQILCACTLSWRVSIMFPLWSFGSHFVALKNLQNIHTLLSFA